LSPLVWFFLWLPDEVLALLFLLHRENGDFSILMKDMLIESSFNLIADGKKANRGNNCFRHHVLGLKGALLHSLLCLSLIFLF
jgi:hypothetical protein